MPTYVGTALEAFLLSSGRGSLHGHLALPHPGRGRDGEKRGWPWDERPSPWSPQILPPLPSCAFSLVGVDRDLVCPNPVLWQAMLDGDGPFSDWLPRVQPWRLGLSCLAPEQGWPSKRTPHHPSLAQQLCQVETGMAGPRVGGEPRAPGQRWSSGTSHCWPMVNPRMAQQARCPKRPDVEWGHLGSRPPHPTSSWLPSTHLRGKDVVPGPSLCGFLRTLTDQIHEKDWARWMRLDSNAAWVSLVVV